MSEPPATTGSRRELHSPRRGRFAHSTPTIEDVARRAGVSRQTVSNVINAPERVKPETIETVREAIDALGYRANRHARNLRTQTSKVIGYCLPPLTANGNSILDTFLHTLVESAEACGYHTLLVTAKDRHSEIEMYRSMTAQSTIDGIVFAQTIANDPRPAALRKMGLPFVSFGRTWGPTDHSWVDVDGAAGTRIATEHLLQLGHRRFAWVAHEPTSIGTTERRRGVHDAVAAAGLSPDAVVEVEVSTTGSTAEQIAALFQRPHPPTGFIAGNDLQAITVLSAAETAGLLAGSDLAVIGFDDSPVASFAGGGLTSIRQPIGRVTSELVRLLNAQFNDPDCIPEGVLLRPELVVRQTG
jgi:DNA-binding LacI/PurR family transcriptional regulator